jgi:hypothetical protein
MKNSLLHTGSIISLLLLIMPITAEGSSVSIVCKFDPPVIESSQGEFSRILFPATVQAGHAGGPSLPFRGVAVLLPEGESITDVKLDRRNWTVLPGKVKLHPRQHVVPGNAVKRPDSEFAYRPELYAQDRWIDPPTSKFRTRYLRGHPVAVGSFSPAVYNPARSEAGYYSEIEITIETAPSRESAEASRFLRNDEATLERLASIVENPGSIPLAAPLAGDLDYLIITRSTYVDDFTPLADFYNSRGILTEIVTVEDIELSYGGADTAERIRNAIMDRYVTDGISHVLLGGDSDGGATDVPHRGLYCAVQSSIVYEDDAIPSDIYFAALDGNWNTDGDTFWGEPGEDDLYSEVSIGRASVDSPDEISTLIYKTKSYQESPVMLDCTRALFLGEHLYSSPLTWGGDEMDQLIGTCTAYGFTTTGVPLSFTNTKYYDRDLGSWSSSVVWTETNYGTGWIFHAGHSNHSYVMRMYTSDITLSNFTNYGETAAFPVAYSTGCMAGQFDYDDCIAEEMVSIPACVLAFLGNSRYGWFTEGTTNGPSHHFMREFVDAVFTEGITTLGAANQRSKDETAPYIDLPDEYEPGAHRWCFYCLNLLGDPAADCWTSAPTAMSVNHPGMIARIDTVFPVETDEPGAVAALYYDGTCLGRMATDGDGRALIGLTDTIPGGADSILFTLTSHDRLTYTASINVTDTSPAGEPIPRLALYQNSPNPFNPFTSIRFSLEHRGHVDLRVYDSAGREVECLAEGTMSEGSHEITWRADRLASGVYFYVLRAGGRVTARKAVLLR